MNWKRAVSWTVAIGAPVIALLAFGMTQNPREIVSPLPGRSAPLFSKTVFASGSDSVLRLEIGDTVNLADHRGQVVVVNFWASWCLACRDEHTALSNVSRQYADRGVRFYGLLYNDQEANGVRWIEQMGGQSYPGLSDPGARAAIDYGLYGVPETFVVDQYGVVAHKYLGAVREDSLSALIDSLLTANASVLPPGEHRGTVVPLSPPVGATK
jgi:cytochrome c biogenesis protein CcmG/thiol:disulfide interchange protein DsbE